jgi:membrane protease YdiL (CAAX protease family)
MLCFDWRRLPRVFVIALPWLAPMTLTLWLSASTVRGHIMAILYAVQTTVFALAGLEAWRRLGRPGLPWTRRLVGERDTVRSGARRWLIDTLLVLSCSMAWTMLLPRFIVKSNVHVPVTALNLVYAPVREELLYRLGIQGVIVRLTRGRTWSIPLAIGTSSLMWGLNHQTAWRLVELVPAGIALGWLQVRHGTESCMVAHAGFNMAVFIRRASLAVG